MQFGFSGWAAPVDSDAVNVMKAGSAVPLKWRLVDYSGTPVTDLASVGVSSVKHACDGDATEDTVEELTSGGSGLQNLGDGNYQLNWKSDKAYAGSCRTLRLDLGEGVPRTAEFRFTR